MVADLRANQAEARRAFLAAIRAGWESLTVIGPSMALEQTYRDALLAVARRPSLEERQAALTRAWQTSAKALQLIRAGEYKSAEQTMDEMYNQTCKAISGTPRLPG